MMWASPRPILLRLWLVPDFSLCIQLTDATANRGLAPTPPVVWMVCPNAFCTGSMALALGGIPDCVSTSRCVCYDDPAPGQR